MHLYKRHKYQSFLNLKGHELFTWSLGCTSEDIIHLYSSAFVINKKGCFKCKGQIGSVHKTRENIYIYISARLNVLKAK